MNFRTFFFLLFIMSSSLFLLLTFYPQIAFSYAHAYHIPFQLSFIKTVSIITANLALIGFLITNHYANKLKLLKEEKKAKERLNIESIHNELLAMQKRQY